MTVISKAALATSLIFMTAAANAQVLFTYGGKSVTKNEFLKAYNKNNSDTRPTDQTYRDYLELYIRFKLKVQAALDKKMDTLANQQAEWNSFRNQIIDGYVRDEASINELTTEAIVRGKKDIHLAHIFVAAGKNATLEDIKKAQDKINAAWDQLQKGQDFAKIAAQYSEDATVSENKGDVGYITSLVLPYELENAVYSTAVNKYSAPVRSKAGFHIFKNLGEREALGRMKVAQILLSFPPDASDAQKEVIKKRADSIYNVLNTGSDFKVLVTRYSNDNISWQAGGEMMEFGVGQYELPFENAAFALKKDGEISRPVLSSFGYHLIKRLSYKPATGDITNTPLRDDMKQRIVQTDRLEVSQKMLLKKILQVTGFKKNKVNEQHLFIFADSVLDNKRTPVFVDVTAKTPLFSFTKKTVAVKDFETYLETLRNYDNMKAGKTRAQMLQEFTEVSAFDYYRQHLEEFNKDFKYQLNEFKEGNLLFEIMQRNIWDPASTDSAGLKNYYNAHKDKYWWESSADAIILTAISAQAEEFRTKMKENYKDWQKYVNASGGQLNADSGRFELNQIPVVGRTNFTEGLITANVKNESDNSVAFAYIVKLYPNREMRGFNDARGFVINDYQVFLEEKWITDLKKKYPVKINEAELKNLPK
ncbi:MULTISPECIES: peptidylprolyl isomerase [Niastella]|uniref:Peptidylprolyl isomerase n=1 Tax=Niastella soli TaxID=2821487 RepID=A0ABS3YNN5_9BACT|nr:peptidylprolyl isomerase [Niastella soli]MBO9199499.1 peptidylprolyl isomerase [Niastella soli]